MYWNEALPEHHRRATDFFALTKPVGAMQVVSRSKAGGRLLCRYATGELRFFALRQNVWEAVGGVIRTANGALMAVDILGAYIANVVCVLFHDGTMVTTTVEDIFHGRPATWTIDSARYDFVRERVMERHAIVNAIMPTPSRGNEYLGDFITVTDVEKPLAFKAFAGRPKFSVDRNSRPVRSKPLPPADEYSCMFALVGCLWTVYPPPEIETWIVDTTVLRLFAKTHAAAIMAKWRGSGLRMASQLRRWLPFCKKLTLCTSNFKQPFPIAQVGAHFAGLHQKEPWINSRATGVFRLMQMWLVEGKLASTLFDTSSDDECMFGLITAHEWMCKHRLQIRAIKLPVPNTKPSCDEASVVGKELIAALERVRGAVGPSSGFETLAHGLTAHLRITHTLTSLALRVTDMAAQCGVISTQMDRVIDELEVGADVKAYVHGIASDSLRRVTDIAGSELLNKGRAVTQRDLHAVSLIAEGVRMLGRK